MPKEADVLTMVEWLLMSAIVQHDNSAYGSIIFDTATELARPVKVSYGSLYPTLERLERQGFLRSSFSDPIPERGGRSRRYFSVTAAGRKAMRHSGLLATRLVGKRSQAWGLA
jgi:PadR family transcriptional regulator PadR